MMNCFFVKADGRYKRISFNEIHYIEAFKNYVRIHVQGKFLLVHSSLKQFEEYLPAGRFFKIHKSYIVALDKITEFDFECVFIGSIQLPLSQNYFETLKSHLLIYCTERAGEKTSSFIKPDIYTNQVL
jgi:DNA-binding LytR/AlgR family response regulator